VPYLDPNQIAELHAAPIRGEREPSFINRQPQLPTPSSPRAAIKDATRLELLQETADAFARVVGTSSFVVASPESAWRGSAPQRAQ
jgi:hypothetical protein